MELILDDADVFTAEDEQQEEKKVAIDDIISSVLEAVLSTSKGPVHVSAVKEEMLVDLSIAEVNPTVRCECQWLSWIPKCYGHCKKAKAIEQEENSLSILSIAEANATAGVTIIKLLVNTSVAEDAEGAKSAAKDEEWLKAMVESITKLEAQYAPHPLPYQGSDGFLYSADVKPPQVDFAALGFNSRRLPIPEPHPVHFTAPSPAIFPPQVFWVSLAPGLAC